MWGQVVNMMLSHVMWYDMMVFVNMWVGARVRVMVQQCQLDSDRAWHEGSCRRKRGRHCNSKGLSAAKSPWITSHKIHLALLIPWFVISNAESPAGNTFFFPPRQSWLENKQDQTICDIDPFLEIIAAWKKLISVEQTSESNEVSPSQCYDICRLL